MNVSDETVWWGGCLFGAGEYFYLLGDIKSLKLVSQ